MSILDLHHSTLILKEWIDNNDYDLNNIVDGEIDPVIDQMLTDLNLSISARVENYCSLMRNLELTAAARKAEADRLSLLANTDANLAKRLKSRLHYFFDLQAITKLETANFRVTVCKNGGAVPLEIIVPASELPSDLQTITITPNMTKIRQVLESGQTIDGVLVQSRGSHLRIK